VSLDVEIVLPLRDGFTLDVSFAVPAGVTVLFGPSGAGKSRTLACIAGIARPARGKITLDREVWFDAKTKESCAIHERRVAYVFQSLALFPHMTGVQNVAYGVPRSIRGETRFERARAMLERMRVPHLGDRKPRTFSGGEAQRVALARAFAMDPRVVLLDEPFSALDAKVKNELLSELKDALSAMRVPAILVTHHSQEARILGDRVVFIEKGRIASTSSVEDANLSLPAMQAAEKLAE
jgi:molybdate transport system ATP-binding protein